MQSWTVRRVSPGLSERIFGRSLEPSLLIPLSWCWVVPLLATLLWLDLGRGEWARISEASEVFFGVTDGVAVSNRWVFHGTGTEHSHLNRVPSRSFASTRMAVSPSTNPPPAQVVRKNVVR